MVMWEFSFCRPVRGPSCEIFTQFAVGNVRICGYVKRLEFTLHHEVLVVSTSRRRRRYRPSTPIPKPQIDQQRIFVGIHGLHSPFVGYDRSVGAESRDGDGGRGVVGGANVVPCRRGRFPDDSVGMPFRHGRWGGCDGSVYPGECNTERGLGD